MKGGTLIADIGGTRARFALSRAPGVFTDELELSEAISIAMFPGSVPNYVEAAKVWRELIASGEVPASDVFRAWAELSGQGGYDEATGVSK